MATLVSLPYPSEGQSPYVTWRSGTKTNAEVLHLSGGFLNRVPRVFEICGISIFLTTSAEVGNRTFKLNHYIAWNETEYTGARMRQFVSTNVAASQTAYSIEISKAIALDTLTTGADESLYIPDKAIILQGSDILAFQIVNNLAGDVYTVAIQAKYLNYELGIREAFEVKKN